jgi:LmbE family N-acetylglucosaminyl deacetylase
MDEERWPPEKMGEVRTAELELSMQILGVAEHHWLDLPDVDMETGLPEEGYASVRDLVADVEPDTILTFGPEGMTGHEAHKSVSRWSTRALRETGKPGSRVLYACATPEWAEEFLPVWEPFNVFLPGTPHVVPREELAIHYELPPDILQIKVNAINAHVSQIESILRAVGEDVWWKEMSLEAFRRSGTSVTERGRSPPQRSTGRRSGRASSRTGPPTCTRSSWFACERSP